MIVPRTGDNHPRVSRSRARASALWTVRVYARAASGLSGPFDSTALQLEARRAQTRMTLPLSGDTQSCLCRTLIIPCLLWEDGENGRRRTRVRIIDRQHMSISCAVWFSDQSRVLRTSQKISQSASQVLFRRRAE